MLNIIFCVFAGVVVLQFLYYLGLLGKFAFAAARVTNPKRIPVSVIVCAKNEAEKVRKFVPLLVAQDYPDFEIVLIDDASSDETTDLFEGFEKQHANVRMVKVANNEAFWGNKKYALTLGIKAAKKEYLLFTDSDCYPASKDWISQMTSHFTLNKTIVLGYGAYEKVKNSFLNKIIRFDGMLAATHYFSWAKAGRPYAGEGRNLAYKKEDFFRVNGFVDHMNIRTGADSLFINQASTKKNTTICFSPESFTYSEPKHSFGAWKLQKRREVFTMGYFRPFDKLHIRFFHCSQLAFLLLAITLFALQFDWRILVPVVVARYIATWLVMGYSAAKLNEKDVVYWYPVIEIILIFTQVNVFLTNIFSKPVHWK